MAQAAQALVDGQVVALGDIPARLRACDLDRAEAMLAVLGALPGDAADARIDVAFERHGPAAPAAAPTQSYGPLDVWRTGPTLYLSYDSAVTAAADADGIVVGGSHPDLADAWRHVFHIAVPHVLALHGRFVLHAAALVFDHGAYLVFGDSGAGKSTLVLAARDAGWGALSDDLAVVRPVAGGLEATGIGKPFRVPCDVLDAGRDTTSAQLHDARERWVVEEFPWERGGFPVRGSIVVGHNRAPYADVDPLASPAVVELAYPSFVGFDDPHHQRGWFPVAAEIGRRGGFRLRHSSDPSVRVHEAAVALDRLARSPHHDR